MHKRPEIIPTATCSNSKGLQIKDKNGINNDVSAISTDENEAGPSTSCSGQEGLCLKKPIVPFLGKEEIERFYKTPAKSGLGHIKMESIQEEPNAENERLPVLLDTLWLTGKVLSFSSISWTGFMSTLESDSLNVDTSIIPLPFINLDPGNLNTIYTALSFAAEKSKRYEKSCIVTFDQPLFQKAVDIVEGSNKSDIVSSVIVRLGGFHTLMSFMGSVGKIMAGSGIEELLTTVYAKITVPHMMSGHAYSRALRGHFLIHEALILIMLDDPEILSEEDIQNIHKWLQDHNPFKCSELLSISTGIIASPDVNCDKAQEIGEVIFNSHIEKHFTDIQCKRKDNIKNLASMNSSIKLHNTYIDFNPMQLFNRIICSNKTPEEIKHCFKYELSPYPLSLFKDGNLRKGTKSQLLQELDKIYKPESMPHSDTVYVIEGGFLLHKVSWQKPASYNDIFLQYVNYVIHNYNKDCVIVFDGYTKEVISTKESLQRCRSKGSIEISIHAQASIQEWIGNNLDPLQYGWKKNKQVEKATGDTVGSQANTSFEEQLIKYIQERPALYNPGLPLLDRTHSKKMALWGEIANLFGGKYAVVDLQKKWKYLRDCYTRAKKKVKEYKPSGSEATAPPNPGFSYYELLKFIDDGASSQRTVCSVTMSPMQNPAASPLPSTSGANSQVVTPITSPVNEVPVVPTLPTPSAKRMKTDGKTELQRQIL
ncbi:unnamed protein product [Ceutorhynchus assimilis]|uniref:MADF domain-containing protein n=1 Tax=Ceutorhynchus assimilis TaxID=467358 RepID=A0A9N9MTN9_9CUCU|nr:unnamed protein product [Ceutorhynchus assimilis]